MKKMIALLLAALMVFAMMACTSTKEPADTEEPADVVTPDDDTQQPDGQPEENPEKQPEESSDEQPEETPADETADVPDDGNATDELDVPEIPLPIEVGDGKLASILTTLLTDLDAEFLPYYTAYEISAEDAPYVIGYEGMDTGFDAALGYGPMMGSTAFIMAAFRLPEGVDAQAYADDLSANADLNKWICVSADFVQATTNGRYVLFLMASDEACPAAVRQELTDRFAALDTAAIAEE